ncbi:MAG: carboxypeptidase-like regulatory domain-containing protein [Bacteroidales bacterium]|jgi:hypothetical protein|nr:carboxypeptidase-like regulatory domain-containing protein [Bacteroidales bacterium]
MRVAKRISIVLALSFISLIAPSQGTVVTGIIKDNRDVPIVGARVCQVNSTNCTVADMNGIFHLLMEPDKEMSLNVTCLGFNPAEAAVSDTTTFPLIISLTPMYFPEETFSDDFREYTNPDIIARSALSLDIVLSDFSEFASLLGTFNTDALDYFAVTGPELGASFPRFYAGLGLGMGYSYKDDIDTVAVDLNNTQFKLSLGYDIISSHRIRMTPMVSLRWLKYRLRNYSSERKVPLQTYLQEKETDLRFNQTAAVIGLNLEYLMYSGNAGVGDHWSVGIFGGYAMKLNRKPWIWSDGNRITTDRSIRLDPFTAGISISFYSQ